MSRSFQNKFLQGSTSLTDYQEGQARANIGADFLAGFRNKIINPLTEIWQRGTSFSIAAGGQALTADRYLVVNSTNQTVVVSQYVMVTGDLASFTNQNIRYALRMNFTVAPTTGQIEVGQRIEGVGTLAGKKVTLSNYMYNGGLANFRFELAQVFGGGGSATAYATGDLATRTPPVSGWTKVQAVQDLPLVNGKIIGTDNYLQFRQFWEPRHATSYYVTSMALVEGDATSETDPTAPRHIQQELALCYRYFEKSFPLNVAPANGPNATSFATITGQAAHAMVVLWGGGAAGIASPVATFMSEKRITSVCVKYGNNSSYWSYIRFDNANLSAGDGTPGFAQNLILYANTKQMFINNQASTTTAVGVSGHWTADAEF